MTSPIFFQKSLFDTNFKDDTNLKVGFGAKNTFKNSDFSWSAGLYRQYNNLNNNVEKGAQLELDAFYTPSSLKSNTTFLGDNVNLSTTVQVRGRLNIVDKNINKNFDIKNATFRLYGTEEANIKLSDKLSCTPYASVYGQYQCCNNYKNKTSFEKNKYAIGTEVGTSVKYKLNDKTSLQAGIDYRGDTPYNNFNFKGCLETYLRVNF